MTTSGPRASARSKRYRRRPVSEDVRRAGAGRGTGEPAVAPGLRDGTAVRRRFSVFMAAPAQVAVRDRAKTQRAATSEFGIGWSATRMSRTTRAPPAATRGAASKTDLRAPHEGDVVGIAGVLDP